MACKMCWVTSQHKRSFLITLIDQDTNRSGRCIVQSPCTCDMQEYLTQLATQGNFLAHDENENEFIMTRPLIMDIDIHSAAHVPLVDPVN